MHHHIPTRGPRAGRRPLAGQRPPRVNALAALALLACAGGHQARAMQPARAATRCVAPLWTAVADIVPAPYAVRVAPGIDPQTLLAWRSPPRGGCRVSAAVQHEWPALDAPWAGRLRSAASSAGLAVIVGPATERVLIFHGLTLNEGARAGEKGKRTPLSPQAHVMPIALHVLPPTPVATHTVASAVTTPASVPPAVLGKAVDIGRSSPDAWQVWQIAAGERMRAALVAWAKRANWTVEWYAEDWRAPVAVEITAKSFLAATHEWTQSAVSNGAPIRVEARTGNRVLIVESTVRNQNGF